MRKFFKQFRLRYASARQACKGIINKQCALVFGILASSAMVGHAQFTATTTTINMAEGGTADVLLVGVR